MLSIKTRTDKILKSCNDAFIDPWRDVERSKLLIAGLLGSFCYSTQAMALNYQLGGLDLETSMTFQILRFALLGLVGVPLSFWLLSKAFAKTNFVLIQILGAMLFFVDQSSGVINAIAYAISISPFFAIYNYNFALKQTDTNRNNETALAHYTLIVASSLGMLCGGWLLEQGMFLHAVMIGCVGGALATLVMYKAIPKKDYVARTRVRLGWKKPSNRITFMASSNVILIDSCLPMWMNVIGISPLAAGVNMAIRPFLGIFLTPLFGWMMKKGPLDAARYVTILLALGWILMMMAYYWHPLIPVGLTLLMAAMNLMSPMEMNRWFKRRSVSATIAREGLMSAGRLPTYVIGIPIIFTAPVLFPVLGFAVGALFAYGVLHRKRSWKERLLFWR